MNAPKPAREGVPGWILLLWAAIFIGIPMIVAALSPSPSNPEQSADHSHISQPTDTPPPVEPVEVLEIPPAEARAINAATPFSTAPNPPARPFLFTGDDASKERAIDCLAAAQLYEAGGDATGQEAVAQVVLNRLRHPAFPKTICEVVFQGAERTTGCQFTFTCDGALQRIPAPDAWDRARTLARKMLSGMVDTQVGYATHYHTDWVVPYWSSSLDKATSIGSHLFFRWKGWWGTAGAFRGIWAGPEPIVPKLAAFSMAHQSSSTAGMGTGLGPVNPLAPDFSDLSRPALEIDRSRIGEHFGPGRLVALNSSGDAFVMLLDRSAAPASFEQLARQLCSGRTKCRMLGWTRSDNVPDSFPIEDEKMMTMSYAYIRSTADGLERSLYNCREYRNEPANHCMRERMPATSPTLPLPVQPLPERQGNETVKVTP